MEIGNNGNPTGSAVFDCNGKGWYVESETSSGRTNHVQTTTQPQNDLTEYNRSKAEMEQKLADENARRQQQANKKQQFNSYYNAGVAAYNRGDYDKAADQFLLALEHATDENERKMASANYDKAISGAKRNIDINTVNEISGVITNVTPTIVNGLAAAHKMKIEERKLYRTLKGNEDKYPEATKHFNNFLKSKRNAKTIGWIGAGVVFAGVVAVSASLLTMDEATGEMNNALFYSGCGVTLAGAGIALFSLPAAHRAQESFEKAKSYVTLGMNSKGFCLVLNF